MMKNSQMNVMKFMLELLGSPLPPRPTGHTILPLSQLTTPAPQ